MSEQSIECLRKLLDECGVKHEDKQFYTYWKDVYGNSWVAKDDGYDGLYCHPCYIITAEQAIEITLGRPVVRCRDCEYFEQGYTDGVMFDETVCWAWENGPDYPSYTNPNGFCHRGKRKES